VRTLAAAVRLKRDEAFHAPMKITAVITAQKPAQRGRVSVRAGIRIARRRGWRDKLASLWDDQCVAFIDVSSIAKPAALPLVPSESESQRVAILCSRSEVDGFVPLSSLLDSCLRLSGSCNMQTSKSRWPPSKRVSWHCEIKFAELKKSMICSWRRKSQQNRRQT
jgi:hypothetical protein